MPSGRLELAGIDDQFAADPVPERPAADGSQSQANEIRRDMNETGPTALRPRPDPCRGGFMATALFIVKATIPRKKEAAFNRRYNWQVLTMVLGVPFVGSCIAL